MIRAPQIS